MARTPADTALDLGAALAPVGIALFAVALAFSLFFNIVSDALSTIGQPVEQTCAEQNAITLAFLDTACGDAK